MTWVSQALKVDSMQISVKFRKATTGYVHWCPACQEAHVLPTTWSFNGDLERPTFDPSFRHSHLNDVCHYNLVDGVLIFHDDCTHAVRGRVALPDLPEDMRD